MHTVSTVARLAGITVRTLHHYDEIGLVAPSERTDAGYRLYAPDDIARLQSVLFYRELGFALDDIARVLDDPEYDRSTALREQRRMLDARVEHTNRLIAAVDAALAAHEEGRHMTAEERLEVFGDFDPREHAAEAEQRWGHTDAYAESTRRASRYTTADWETIRDEGGSIAAEFARLAAGGADPTSQPVRDLAERHRLHIDRWFYPCSHEMHAGLADMYVADQRFADWWDRFDPGLAPFVKDAILANGIERS